MQRSASARGWLRTLERMNTNAPNFPVLEIKYVDERAFVEFWSARYPAVNEPIYQAYIGKPLTEKRLLELFRWKNNGPIAKHKLESIRRNYIENRGFGKLRKEAAAKHDLGDAI